MNPPEGSKPGDSSHVKVSLSAWWRGVLGSCRDFGGKVLGVLRKGKETCLIPESCLWRAVFSVFSVLWNVLEAVTLKLVCCQLSSLEILGVWGLIQGVQR